MKFISGSGGGGGSKGGGGATVSAKEDPNTLQSNAYARVIDLHCAGEIQGLCNGLQSVFFSQNGSDFTPVQNADGSYNFNGITIDTRNGTPRQDYMKGFPNLESEVAVGIEVTQASPIARTINNSEIDALRVKVQIPTLTQQNPDTYDLQGTSVSFKIEVQPYGGSYAPSLAHYVFNEMQGTTSATNATGVAILLSQSVYAKTGSRVSINFAGQYKAVSAGSWTDFTSNGGGTYVIPDRYGDTSAFTDISWSQVNTGKTDKDGNYIYEWWMTGKITTTLSVTELAANQYQVQATSGTILKFYSLDYQDFTISGKCTSAYERQYLIPLPSGGSPWNVRITRITADSDQASIQNKTIWATYTELTYTKVEYSDCAIIGLQANAKQFGNQIPQRAYEIFGKKIQIPSNYDPDARTYTSGVWDGTFTTAYSNNPAWVLYDILTDSINGLGMYIASSNIDKAALYTIGQYCDELVDDGFGGTEPRFTFNGIINQREDCFKVVQAICSAFRGMAFWGQNTITAIQDSPSDVKQLVTPSNVIEGVFTYSSTGLKARHNVANVTFRDELIGYQTRIIPVENDEGLELFDRNEVDTEALFCTSFGQATRWGKWILDSELNESETVTYRTSFDHIACRPGDIIEVADPNYAGIRMGGRIARYLTWYTTSSDDLAEFYDTSSEIWSDDAIWYCLAIVELDDTVTLSTGETYTLECVLADGTVESKTVMNTVMGEVKFLYLTESFTTDAQKGAQWVLTSSVVSPRKFRVIAIRETAKNELEVTGIYHDTTKYARVEQDLQLEQPNFSTLPSGALARPTNLSVQEYLYSAGASVKSAVTLSWQLANDSRVEFYEVKVMYPGEDFFKLIGKTANTSIDILDTSQGAYQFSVASLTRRGVTGDAVILEASLNALSDPPANVSNFRISVIDGAAHLSWNAVTDLDLDHYILCFSPEVSGVTWASAQVLVERISKNQTSITVPSLVGTYLIKAVDTSEIESINETLIISEVGNINLLNVVETLSEDPHFNGAKTNCDLDSGGGLQLVGSSLSGVYEFYNELDLGAVYTSRITADIIAQGVTASDFVSAWGLISQHGLISSTSAGASNWSVTLQLRQTNDDPTVSGATWTDWMDFVIGDYKARAFQFKLLFSSDEDGLTPYVTTLSVTVDMPDRIISNEDVTVPVTGLNISYSPVYKALRSVNVTIQDGNTGDYPRVTSKSATGCIVTIYDSGGSPVQRVCDITSIGYGCLSA